MQETTGGEEIRPNGTVTHIFWWCDAPCAIIVPELHLVLFSGLTMVVSAKMSIYTQGSSLPVQYGCTHTKDMLLLMITLCPIPSSVLCIYASMFLDILTFVVFVRSRYYLFALKKICVKYLCRTFEINC